MDISRYSQTSAACTTASLQRQVFWLCHVTVQMPITFADRGYRMVSAADPYGRTLAFLSRSRYYFFQVAPHCVLIDLPPTPHQAHNPNNDGRALLSAPPQAIAPNPHTNLLNVYMYTDCK
jgi:hypothetical protein